ncbi:hypothetical protein [Pandoraea communis]|uniref:hypothetical protein n=1 Tax=Pandoraea communis TaxID=2508297 RepID=UPI0015836B4F|nr:hypothetical protein [Pandoraea communis]
MVTAETKMLLQRSQVPGPERPKTEHFTRENKGIFKVVGTNHSGIQVLQICYSKFEIP